MRRALRLMGVVVLLMGAACLSSAAQKGPGQIDKERAGARAFGKTAGGKEVVMFVLKNRVGMTAKVITYGATLTELSVPDKAGTNADVLLGFDDIKGFESKGNPFFGCIVGRYANRIAGGKFTLDGTEYKLAKNNGPNHLHGGIKGFDKVLWEHTGYINKAGSTGVTLRYVSPDGEEGYPGKLTATVTYELTKDNELKITYEAKTDKATPINLTNHAYFNLDGQAAGSILDHQVTLFADKYTPVDGTLIPTGKIEPVKATPYDFRKSKKISASIGELKGDPKKGDPGGYDINYVINGGGKKLALAARVVGPKSGRVMEMLTTEPGVQFYTGNFLDGTVKGKGGAVYGKHTGFCLEAQHFPDSPNQKGFPSTILRPGETYRQRTVYRFSVLD